MEDYLLFTIYVALGLVFIVNQILFGINFNKLKSNESDYLDSKLKKYSRFDSRTQVAKLIFKGDFEGVSSQELRKKLKLQRVIMMLGLGLFFLALIIFVLGFSK